MVNLEQLKKAIQDSGITMTALSRKSGVSRETLYNRLRGIGEFTASEIVGVSEALHLSLNERDHIFLAEEVGQNSTAL